MREFSSDFLRRVESDAQTVAENAQPYANLRISRKDVPLHNARFLDKRAIRKTSPNLITDADIAISHQRFRGEDDTIWACYIRNGKLAMRYGKNVPDISETSWTQFDGLGMDAEACALAFDAEVYQNARGIQEFITKKYPYLFYVHDGQLNVIMINEGAWLTETLAEQNVTDVSAVRAPEAIHYDWDMGLTVFFLMNGQLYYRQFINGVWYDAELVTLTIPDETYVKIEAFRTWDYRVGVQVLTQSGKLYQIITYTEGIGVRGVEHIKMHANANVVLSGIKYSTFGNNIEHVEMTAGSVVRLLYGHSVVVSSIHNIEVDDDWGTTIQVIFDYPVHADNLTASMFTLVDSRGTNYVCEGFEISGGGEGRALTLTFADFNLAGLASNMTLTYTKPSSGGLMSPAVQTDSFSETFVPVNLVPPAIDPPTFLRAESNAEGTEITLYLTEHVTNTDVSGMASNFSVSLQEYDYVPNGTLQNTTRAITRVSPYGGTQLPLANASNTNVEYINGGIQLEVDDG